jgi:hypothetical protein
MSNPGPAVTVSAHPSNVTTAQTWRLLAISRGVNVAATGNVAVPIINSTAYLPETLLVTNSSASTTTAALSVYTGSGATGSEVFASLTLANNATALGVTSESAYETTTAYNAQTLYINVGTAQSGAGTVDVYIYGYDFSV